MDSLGLKDSIMFGTLNWVSNDIPGVSLDDVPTIVIFKKGSKKQIKSTGLLTERKTEEFLRKKLKIYLDDERNDL